MSSATVDATPDLTLTASAAAKVKELMEKEGNDTLKLRVYVEGGGCSGFQYGFMFDENLDEDDMVVENAGVTLVVDPMSVQYLAGASVDYTNDLQGSRFFVHNPGATTTCGCGASFSI